MHARWVLAAVALSLAASSWAIADEPTAKRSTAAVDARQPPSDEMLHRYVLDQARQQFEARRKVVSALKAPADITRRNAELRAFSSVPWATCPSGHHWTRAWSGRRRALVTGSKK